VLIRETKDKRKGERATTPTTTTTTTTTKETSERERERERCKIKAASTMISSVPSDVCARASEAHEAAEDEKRGVVGREGGEECHDRSHEDQCNQCDATAQRIGDDAPYTGTD
jgi:hypothetical protein